jgi:hypothetical protein
VIHVLAGAAVPLLACVAIYAGRGFRAGWGLLVLGPLAMLASGAVAVIPDMPRLLGHQSLYNAWHRRGWCNLAWGHCWIDKHEGIEDWRWWPVIAVVVGTAVLGVALRELHLRERAR